MDPYRRNKDFFQANKGDLVAKYGLGSFLLIVDEQVVGAFPTSPAAFAVATAQFGFDKPFLIQGTVVSPRPMWIPAVIGVAPGQAAIMTSVPPPWSGHALIDTGAAASCVDVAVARDLGLMQVGVVQSQGSFGGPRQAPVFFAQMRFGNCDAVQGRLVGVDANREESEIAIVGRDILRHSYLHVAGPEGRIVMDMPADAGFSL